MKVLFATVFFLALIFFFIGLFIEAAWILLWVGVILGIVAIIGWIIALVSS